MSELLYEVIRDSIQCIIVLFVMNQLLEIRQSTKMCLLEIAYTGINVMCALSLGESLIELHGIYVVSIMFYACIYLMLVGQRSFITIIAVMMFGQITEAACSILIAVIEYPLSYFIKMMDANLLLTITNCSKLLLLPLLYYWMNHTKIRYHLSRTSVKFMLIFLGCTFQICRYYIYVVHEGGNDKMAYVIFLILVMGIFTGIAWLIDWKLREKERETLWEDNKRMSSEIHRSKEILPAITSTLDKLVEDRDNEELVREIRELCGEQMRERQAEDMQTKQFPPTGVTVLDEQLKMFGQEAAKRSVNMDVFVADPVKPALKQQKIQEMDFLRLVGDLTRNALRAVEDETGNILLIFGYLGGNFQVEIYDDGSLFPEFILKDFGKRGLTTGGTGNGLADILECVDKYQASYHMEEYDEKDQFTKEIRIVWDGLNQHEIKSKRI